MHISLQRARSTNVFLFMFLFLTVFLPLTLFGQFATADTGVIYGSTGGNDGGRFIVINPDSGYGTLVDSSTNEIGFPGLAIDSHGNMYAASDYNQFYRVDAETGEYDQIDVLPGQFTPAIAFNHQDELYGLAYIGDDEEFGTWYLVTIDTTTGVFIKQINITYREWRGLAFDPKDGSLYASTSDGEIYLVNPFTGDIIYVTSSEVGGIPDVAFDNDGNFYATVRGEESDILYNIDKSSGLMTPVGNIGFSYISGLAGRTLPLTGPQLAIFPPTLDFSVQGTGTVGYKQLWIWNIGSETLNISDISSPAEPFHIQEIDFPISLGPDSMTLVLFTFHTSEENEFLSEIIITSNDVDDPNRSVSLIGETVEPPTGFLFASDNRTGYLNIINPFTAEAEMVGSLGFEGEAPGVTEIEFREDGILFMTYGGGFSAMATLNIFTGEWELVGFHESGAVNGLDFNEDGTLYGTWISGPEREPSWLVTLNTSNAFMDTVGQTGYSNIRGLAFSPGGEYLFGVGPDTVGGDTTDILMMIDVETGVAAKVGPTGFTHVSSLEFGPDSILYACISYPGDSTLNGGLLTVDPVTGAGSFIGVTGAQSLSGISFYPGMWDSNPTALKNEFEKAPQGFHLSQNYPNPFNPKTVINFNITKPGFITLKVYNVIGQLVETLLSEELEAGLQSYNWDASHLASGLYFYKLESGSQTLIRKAILMK